MISHPRTHKGAVLIAAYNESEQVLEETIASVLAMDYPAMRVCLLDDSTKPECRTFDWSAAGGTAPA